MREKREKETVSHARLSFNTKSNTLDTIQFALGEGSVLVIDGRTCVIGRDERE